MTLFIHSPSWFFGIDAVLQSVTVFVAIFLFFMSYKIYKILKEKSFLYFSAGFLSISLAYGIKIFADMFTYKNMGGNFTPWINLVIYRLSTLEFVNIFGHLAFRFLVLLGFLILLITLLKINDGRIIFLLMYFVFITSAFSAWSFLLFQTTLTVFAGVLGIYYLFHYIQNQKKLVLYSLMGFAFLFAAQVSLMFTYFFENQMFVVGHVLQAIGFIILFITYLMVLRK